MTDLEALLTRELHAVADEQSAPTVDLLGVRRVARRVRRRRGAALVAAAAVMATVCGVALIGSGDDDGVDVAAYDLPLGASLTLPWTTADRTVHVDGRSLVVPHLRQGIASGRTTLVGTQVGDEPMTWSRVVPEGDGLTLAPLAAVQDDPSVSYDGRWVAWIGPGGAEGGRARAQIVTRLDTTTGQLDTTELEAVGNGPGLEVGSIDGSGRVLVGVPDGGQLLWVPGAEPVPVAGLPADAASASLVADGLALVAEDHQSGPPPVVWRIADAGTATRVGPISGTAKATFVGPDGAHYVTAVGDDLAVARLDPDGSSTLGPHLGLPGLAGRWVVFGWESPIDVVLARSVDQRILDVVRCAADTGYCERVPDQVWSGFGYE